MFKKNLTKIEKKRAIISLSIIVSFLILIMVLGIVFWPQIKIFFSTDEAVRQQLIEKIKSYGPYAWLILILAMCLQVVVAILPSGPFELASGIIYGPYLGFVILSIGEMLGALLVIFLVRKLGKPFSDLFVNTNDGKMISLLKDENRCLVLMFALLFIPAIPKDFIVFLVPFTNVKTWKFLIINFIAKTPSNIATLILGESLMAGNFTVGIIVFGICFVIGLVCLIFNKQIVEFLNKRTNKGIDLNEEDLNK